MRVSHLLLGSSVLFVPQSLFAQTHHCSANEVPYLEAGCDGPARYRCWNASVRPTPQTYCGCDNNTFQSSVPTTRWRSVGPCVVPGQPGPALRFVYAPSNAARTPYFAQQLFFEGPNFRATIGSYLSCEAQTAVTPTLYAVRCAVNATEFETMELRREANTFVVTAQRGQTPARQAARETVVDGARATVQPLVVLAPEAPRPIEVRYVVVPQWLPGGAPGPRRQLHLSLDRSDRRLGVFDRCREAPAIAPVLIAASCEDAPATVHQMTVTRQGDALVVQQVTTTAQGPQAPREVLRVPLPAGATLRPNTLDGS